jgi:hypothetical protein
LKAQYQNLLHDDKSTSAFPAEVMLDVLSTETFLFVLGRLAFGVFECSRREDGAVREGAAFVLTIGAVTDRLSHGFALAFEFNCAAQTGTVIDHFDGLNKL